MAGRQPKRRDSQYLVLDNIKSECCTIILHDLVLSGFFGMISAMENGTLNLETQQTELAGICQMGQSSHSCLMERVMKISDDGQELFINEGQKNIWVCLYICINIYICMYLRASNY